MSDLLSKYPPLQWEPAVTKVFVVVLEKDGHTVMLGTTNRVEAQTEQVLLASGARLVMSKSQGNRPVVMAFFDDEKSDAQFRRELDERTRAGYMVRGEPMVITTDGEPWGNDQIQLWADVVFGKAEDRIFWGRQ